MKKTLLISAEYFAPVYVEQVYRKFVCGFEASSQVNNVGLNICHRRVLLAPMV